MTKLLTLTFVMLLMITASKTLYAQNEQEAKDKIQELKDRLDGVDERLAVDEIDIAGLKKIKISGYMQAQFEKYEANVYPKTSFFLRRVRIKTTYEATDGVKFVVTPDFVNNNTSTAGNFALKDAYVVVNDPFFHTFQLWAGQFNRPNYEVEYSSSQREVPERSRVIGALYPGERDMGVKLEVAPSSLPLKLQVALLNGTGVQNKDVDNFKDIMARITYSLSMPESGIGFDFGANTYIGGIKAGATKVLKSDYSYDADVMAGDKVSRSWFGVEFQLYADILGGMSIKGEYITGSNAMIATGATQLKDFSGYYLYLIKNLGSANQFALRYDVYDPNTKFSGDDIGNPALTNAVSKIGPGTSDIKWSTLTLALHNYWDDNIRITLAYAMVTNEKTTQTSAAFLPYNNIIPNNTLTLRFQSKF